MPILLLVLGLCFVDARLGMDLGFGDFNFRLMLLIRCNPHGFLRLAETG